LIALESQPNNHSGWRFSRSEDERENNCLLLDFLDISFAGGLITQLNFLGPSLIDVGDWANFRQNRGSAFSPTANQHRINNQALSERQSKDATWIAVIRCRLSKSLPTQRIPKNYLNPYQRPTPDVRLYE
jgi:hypothetical protein